jgi:hypothetical protein
VSPTSVAFPAKPTFSGEWFDGAARRSNLPWTRRSSRTRFARNTANKNPHRRHLFLFGRTPKGLAHLPPLLDPKAPRREGLFVVPNYVHKAAATESQGRSQCAMPRSGGPCGRASQGWRATGMQPPLGRPGPAFSNYRIARGFPAELGVVKRLVTPATGPTSKRQPGQESGNAIAGETRTES